ncbi:dihydropteroate synthase [Clostridium beijerinckii]|jgi:Dihydropteroate synthase (EC 2.5.1.15)|uniref:Dihydropteroate synthase n=2 Tax=Clostridium beijerinckii TaxID=1520 RepID=DHPS_CLOB8|nr:dihydropteroate synthase [Clostridium beijerinckii]Q05621.2 RecName: Full=Dihydropteroate synthase; Short=DHPS; AltName: Full=Dihydropteroate pyrophosphorylase [Clostridium beijerinckii NCIMB 8052]ABR32396.1 dihydropteroate synthase [Clostridium beijerinckii NCIMB 8052]AIU04239.1 dihydropteroate synthase [Clostridium beijerinckii ATCC 35702]MBF7807926.1 dihydropteroate synthase [Clostridium beijerinckii]NRT26382.1 dihydropteroate synthase [Clostridium beijerinckii]NRT66011.1 dihydropteroat
MKIGSKEFNIGERTYIMGILNFTPDSFSDGGKFNDIDVAVKHVKEMIDNGADIIDVGGESTRPGYEIVSEEEEISRVVPIIKAIKEDFDIPVSIDTYKAKVAEQAIEAGANLINDIWGFKKDKDMAKVAAKYNVPCCLMHNRDNTEYKNLMEDILNDLKECINIAKDAGVKDENIILDPGIGFGKTYEQNLEAMNNLERIKELGYPILLGTSRKSMIGLALNLPVEERIEGTVATTVIGIMKDACDFVRVHDVLENSRAAKMTDIIVRR